MNELSLTAWHCYWIVGIFALSPPSNHHTEAFFRDIPREAVDSGLDQPDALQCGDLLERTSDSFSDAPFRGLTQEMGTVLLFGGKSSHGFAARFPFRAAGDVSEFSRYFFGI